MPNALRKWIQANIDRYTFWHVLNYITLCFNKLTNILHLHFCLQLILLHKFYSVLFLMRETEIIHNYTIRWYRLPNGSTFSLPPLPQTPSYYHLAQSLTHSSPVTGRYGNCNQEVHSLHHERFVLEDERFVERSCDGVKLGAGL